MRWLTVPGSVLITVVTCAVGTIPRPCTAELHTPDETATATTAQAPTSLPAVHVRQPDGFDDEQSFSNAMTEQADSIVKAGEQQQNRRKRVEMFLSAANLLLARRLESAATSRILHLPDDAKEPSQVTTVLDRADSLISRAREELDAPADNDSTDAPENKDVSRRLTILSAFRDAMRVYLTSTKMESTDDLRKATSELSPFLEDEDASIASAANLWRACLRSREGDVSRAIEALPLPSSAMKAEDLPYGFFAREFRCRLHGEHGGNAPAIAMLIQLEERSADWFSDKNDLADAVRTSQWLQIDTLMNWRSTLAKDTQADEREWCSERIDHLVANSFSGDATTVMRLSPAIPLVFPLPDLPTEAPSQPSLDN